MTVSIPKLELNPRRWSKPEWASIISLIFAILAFFEILTFRTFCLSSDICRSYFYATSLRQNVDTVIFHYFGMPQQKSKEVITKIRQVGWNVDGGENKKSNASINVIRYNPDDSDAAKLLLTDANKILKDLNIEINLGLEKLAIIDCKKPEIWIENK